MSRINTNVQSMITQRVLATNNANLSQSLERLSTGLRVNRGKDDPAGLIASENLRNEQKGLSAAVSNAERADQVANIAESGLAEVSGLLNELQGLVTTTANSAGLSIEERQANQLVVDSILQTIDRVSSSTNFQGVKLLDGNMDYRTSSIAAGVTDFRIGAAKFSGARMGVDVMVTQSAQQAGVFLSMGSTSLNLTTNSSFVIEVSGSKGSRELSFASGTSLAKVASVINSFSDVTGVTAALSATSSTKIGLASSDFGSAEFVSVRVINSAGINSTNNGGAAASRGVYNKVSSAFNTANTTIASTFANAGNAVRDLGQDIGGTINGMAMTAKGKAARVNSDFLDADITLSTSAAQTLGNVGSGSASALYVTGGGAEFQLDGKANVGGKVSLGVQSIAVNKLGSRTVGFLKSLASGQANNLVSGDRGQAQKIITEVATQISSARGRVGTFQRNVVGGTIRNLNVAIENTAAAASIIRDADFASETAALTRSQILVSASTNILSLANQAPNSALQLLG